MYLGSTAASIKRMMEAAKGLCQIYIKLHTKDFFFLMFGLTQRGFLNI